MGGKTHAHVGDECGATGGAFFDDVQHVASGEHGEVGRLADPVGQRRQQRAPEPGEGLLTRVSAAQFERGRAQTPASVTG